MEEYLDRGIKEVIDQYPEVEGILDEYGIGCGPCAVGTCLLKDIVEVHGLTEEAETEMMARIAKAVYPDRVVKIPQVQRKEAPSRKEIGYSPPMKTLVDEHVLIKRWVALIPEVVKNLDVDTEEGRRAILDGIDFIRSYADRYHHAKEEEILFQYFDENLEILRVMHEDHEKGRAHVKAMLEAVENKDKSAVAKHLTAYADLLKEHIRKEDQILYPWMDKNLNTTQIGELFSKFREADEQMGYSPEKHQTFIETLENQFKTRGGK